MWYFTDEDNPILPVLTPFRGFAYDRGARDTGQLGEVPGSYEWSEGIGYDPENGDHYCGSDEVWENGATADSPVPPPSSETGLPCVECPQEDCDVYSGAGVYVNWSPSGQIIISGLTQVTFNGELWDTDDYWSADFPGQLLIPSDGLYRVMWNYLVSHTNATTTEASGFSRIYRNGTSDVISTNQTPERITGGTSDAFNSFTFVVEVALEKDDVLLFYLTGSTPGTVVTTYQRPFSTGGLKAPMVTIQRLSKTT